MKKNVFTILLVIVSLTFCYPKFNFGTTYYVSPNGNDNNNGTSISTPWKSVKKVSLFGLNTGFSAGSIIKFEGGKVFESDTIIYGISGLVIQNSGTISSPIIITSYDVDGLGKRATIKTDSTKAGIVCLGQYIQIRSLNFISNYNPYNQTDITHYNNIGIWFFHSSLNKKKGIIIDSCNISQFKFIGIQFACSDTSKPSGYQDIKILNTRIDSIGHEGIEITFGGKYSFSNFPNKDITIRNCEISRVKGLYWKSFSGDGILLVDIDSALVERNLVYSCGGVQNGTSGPTAIEAARCNNLIFQYNETYDQKSNTGSDGGGMHFGDGVQNSIMQYNYSHDNDGPGFNCHSYDLTYPLSDSNNVIRYNISAKNGRNADYHNGEISISSGNGKNIYNINVYNNTIYTKKYSTSLGTIAGMQMERNVVNSSFRNNIVISTDSSIYMFYRYPGYELNDSIQGNAYWSTKNYYKFSESNTEYYSYNSWQSNSGREKRNNLNVGFIEDPKLINPSFGGNVNNPYKLDTLSSYKTKPGSIIVENGLNLYSLFGINSGNYDFYGTTIPNANKFDIGAYEDTSSFVIIDLTILIQGFYDSNTDNQVSDTLNLYLAESSSPYSIFDSSKIYLSSKGKGYFIFNTDMLSSHGNEYYLVAKHRNSIETWSANSLSLNLQSGRFVYDFASDSSKAFGNNVYKKGSKWCVFSCDVNQDGTIDLNDGQLIENDILDFTSGYVPTDVNGDNIVDINDITVFGLNENNFIYTVKP